MRSCSTDFCLFTWVLTTGTGSGNKRGKSQLGEGASKSPTRRKHGKSSASASQSSGSSFFKQQIDTAAEELEELNFRQALLNSMEKQQGDVEPDEEDDGSNNAQMAIDYWSRKQNSSPG